MAVGYLADYGKGREHDAMLAQVRDPMKAMQLGMVGGSGFQLYESMVRDNLLARSNVASVPDIMGNVATGTQNRQPSKWSRLNPFGRRA